MMNLAFRWSYFCTYLQCWSENFLLRMGVGEIRTCIMCCLRDIKVMETAKQSSIYNKNSCKCLREALTIQWACSPQSDCISFFRDPCYFLTLWNQNLFPWCNTGGEVSLQAESWKVPTFYVQNISGYREKNRRSLKYQNKISFHISLCDRSKVIVNQTDRNRKFT